MIRSTRLLALVDARLHGAPGRGQQQCRRGHARQETAGDLTLRGVFIGFSSDASRRRPTPASRDQAAYGGQSAERWRRRRGVGRPGDVAPSRSSTSVNGTCCRSSGFASPSGPSWNTGRDRSGLDEACAFRGSCRSRREHARPLAAISRVERVERRQLAPAGRHQLAQKLTTTTSSAKRAAARCPPIERAQAPRRAAPAPARAPSRCRAGRASRGREQQPGEQRQPPRAARRAGRRASRVSVDPRFAICGSWRSSSITCTGRPSMTQLVEQPLLRAVSESAPVGCEPMPARVPTPIAASTSTSGAGSRGW